MVHEFDVVAAEGVVAAVAVMRSRPLFPVRMSSPSPPREFVAIAVGVSVASPGTVIFDGEGDVGGGCAERIVDAEEVGAGVEGAEGNEGESAGEDVALRIDEVAEYAFLALDVDEQAGLAIGGGGALHGHGDGGAGGGEAEHDGVLPAATAARTAAVMSIWRRPEVGSPARKMRSPARMAAAVASAGETTPSLSAWLMKTLSFCPAVKVAF